MKEQKKVEDMLSEIDNTMMDDALLEAELTAAVKSGPLTIDSKYLKSGFHYEFVSDLPGDIEKKKKLGYEVVIDDFKVGQEKASTTHRFGSAVTVQSKCGQLLVLMSVSQERFDKIMSIRKKLAKENQKAFGHIEGVPEKYQQFDGKALGECDITYK